VADNDLALGRIVEYLSHSPWWRSMAIFITEDDAGGGVDPVDAHRTVMLVASPWVKPGCVAHTDPAKAREPKDPKPQPFVCCC
jgi:hypothetical protein